MATALLVGAAVWISSTIQRNSSESGRADHAEAQTLLTSMFEMENAVRGFQLTGLESVARPFDSARVDYSRALTSLSESVEGEAADHLDRLDLHAQVWQEDAAAVIAEVRRELSGPVGGSGARHLRFESFRAEHTALERALDDQRERAATMARIGSVAIALALALVIGLVGDRVVNRRDRAESRRRDDEARYRLAQTEFVESMQLTESEDEANELIRRHIERTVDGSRVMVLNRNNSANRLDAATGIDDADIAHRLIDAEPRTCLAIRLGRDHRHCGDDRLARCGICSTPEGCATCWPLVVGSEVIGSVLVCHDEPLDDAAHDRLRDSVAQAAPALANLRNLALAERRAGTDSLTGLPNRRSITDNLKRMAAHATRSEEPLSALMLDLDHFKTINDLYGHDAGDEVLAAIGDILRESVRASDFAGRYGGEEFIVLAPDTMAEGARVLAENLRSAIEALRVPSVEHRLTASIGVASFPASAVSGAGLVRIADRALYLAKERGRNRVELADTVLPSTGEGAPPATAASD